MAKKKHFLTFDEVGRRIHLLSSLARIMKLLSGRSVHRNSKIIKREYKCKTHSLLSQQEKECKSVILGKLHFFNNLCTPQSTLLHS